MSSHKIPVNVGGETGSGKGGVLGEATLTFTPGGVYVDVSVEGLDAEFPTVGFDRQQLSGVLVGENINDVFTPKSQWCPVCKTDHVDPGEKTDAGKLTRPCPKLAADDPRNRKEGA